MAYDDMGNWVDDSQNQSYLPPDQSQPQNTGVLGPSSFSGISSVGPNNQQASDNYNSGNWDAQRVANYFRDRLHVAPNSTSPDYWAQKWNEWGSKDPAYFMMRLNHADETGNPYTNGMTDSNIPGQSGSHWNPMDSAQSMGAQPYNPYAPKTANGNAAGTASNYFQKNNVTPTGQTDGTLLGTSFNPGNGIGKPMSPGNGGAARKPYSWLAPNSGNNSMGNSSPMGAPSFYGNQQKQQNPVPQNNMGGSF